MRNDTKQGVPIACRQDRKSHHRAAESDWLLDNTQVDTRSLTLYKRAKAEIRRLVSCYAKKDAHGNKSVFYGQVSRRLKPEYQVFMEDCLLDLASDGVVKYSANSIAPSRITQV